MILNYYCVKIIKFQNNNFILLYYIKTIMANLLEMIQSNDLLKLALILLGVYLFVNYMKKESMENIDSMSGGMPSEMMIEGVENVPATTKAPVAEAPAKPAAPAVPKPMEASEGTEAPVPSAQSQLDKIVSGKTQLEADELLPKYDQENEFAKQNPVSDLLKEQNFLISGYHVGINTVMQSNKIPYHDLRSAPPIPKENVSPFLNSSYEVPAGTGRRFLEIGS